MQRLVIASSQLQKGKINLNSQQIHYLKRVLRLQSGDRFIALDGKGQAWIAQIDSNNCATVIASTPSSHRELAVNVTLIVALPKGNSFEEIVRCCTELGVSTIIPIKSDRTLVQPSSHKLERWRRIANEATEQSERNLVPTITEPVSFPSLIRQYSALSTESQQRYIGVARTDANHLLTCLHLQISKSDPNRNLTSIVIATGPEGGWTPEEIKQSSLAGFLPVSLGNRIFRAVTAPIVALSLVAAMWESSFA